MTNKSKPTSEIKQTKTQPNHGEAVKYYRNRLGYSQDYVGKKVGVSQQQISSWEDQKLLPNEILQKFADLFDLGIIWLRDIPLENHLNSYSQDGDGNTNFQNNGNVEYHLNYPIKELEQSYNETVAQINTANKESLDILREEINKKNTEIENLWSNYNKLNNTYLNLLTTITQK